MKPDREAAAHAPVRRVPVCVLETRGLITRYGRLAR